MTTNPPQKKKKPSSEKRGVLFFISQKGANEAIKLRRDATIFGREKGDIIIQDNEVSSTHCQIQNINGVYHIFDMNSTNGTFVNNERIVKAKLNHGDIVTIGQTSVRFQLEEESNVRHIATIFKSKEKRNGADSKSSLVDTLIEGELRSTQPQTVVLSVRYADGSGDEIELNQRVLFIGRASSFGKFESDPEISRKHLMIKVNDTGEVFIEDQGSTNGSFLNGKKITGMHLVRPQDEVRVGTSTVKIRAKSA
jgi:pSer/pThr/pTyr-binding forkhead associated (FHA) protein